VQLTILFSITHFKTVTPFPEIKVVLHKPEVLSPFPETVFFNFNGRISWNGTGSFCGSLAGILRLQFSLIVLPISVNY
jgi:hypothetical protein